MVKEIDVGASQMGIEILTNKGSKDNPTKSVEIQKPPETPYTDSNRFLGDDSESGVKI